MTLDLLKFFDTEDKQAQARGVASLRSLSSVEHTFPGGVGLGWAGSRSSFNKSQVQRRLATKGLLNKRVQSYVKDLNRKDLLEDMNSIRN